MEHFWKGIWFNEGLGVAEKEQRKSSRTIGIVVMVDGLGVLSCKPL